MRTLKFRAWDRRNNVMVEADLDYFTDASRACDFRICVQQDIINNQEPLVMQFTGLHDKNSLKELYEGDIIDADGNLKGNIYESPQIYEEGIDCLIEGMGTEKWRSTESIAMGRGCKYTK